MANVPYTGVPDTAPPSQPPSDYQQPQSVRTPIGAFGERSAAGLESLGEGAQQAGQFFGQVAADHAYNSYQDSVNKILHGDPTKMVTQPDGTQTPDVGYLGLKGEAAMRGRPDVVKQMNDLRQKTVGTLPSPAMQLQFDTNARRFQAVSTSEVGTHADTQTNVWATGVNTAKAKNGLDTISANPDNPQMLLDSREQVRQAYVKNAQLKFGNSPEIIQHAIHEADKDSVKAQVLAIGARPDGASAAMRIVENNKDALGADFHVLADHFRSRVETEGAVGSGIDLFNELNNTTPAGVPNANNIGNVRPKGGGANSGFVQVDTFDKGVALTVNNARSYPAIYNGGAPMSIDQIAQHWTADNKEGWAKNVAAGSGLPSNQPLDLKNPQVAAQFARGVHAAEKGGAAARPVADYLPGASGQDTQTAANDDTAPTPLNAPPGLKAPETPLEKLARITQEGVERIEKMNLPSKQKEQTLNAFRTQVATHELAINLTKKAQDEAYHKALGGYVDDMVSGKTGDIVQRINQDPAIPPEHKWPLIETASKASGNPQGVVNFGPGWLQASQGVLKKPGEDGYIGDATDILKMGPAGTNQLTMAGVQDVLHTRAQAAKDIDQHGIQQTRASVMKWAYSQMVVDHEMLFPGIPPRKDKKGEDAYDGTFVPKVNAAFAQFMKKPGADQLEFWTQDNMRTLMSGIRSPSDVAAERALSGLQKPITQQPIPAAPEGVNNNSWQTVMKSVPVTKDGKQWPAQDWADAINILRANPTPDMIKFFDKRFGAGGYSGKEILDHLKAEEKVSPTAPPVAVPMPAMAR